MPRIRGEPHKCEHYAMFSQFFAIFPLLTAALANSTLEILRKSKCESEKKLNTDEVALSGLQLQGGWWAGCSSAVLTGVKSKDGVSNELGGRQTRGT